MQNEIDTQLLLDTSLMSLRKIRPDPDFCLMAAICLSHMSAGSNKYGVAFLLCDRGFISERELMFMFAICRRLSVCLSSVMFVHPTQAIEIFGNVSAPCNTLVT